MAPKLMAVSDIHVGHKGNRPITERICTRFAARTG